MNRYLVRNLILVLLIITIAVGCGPHGEKLPTPVPPTPVPPTPVPVPELVGLADYHTHQFGYLGFGGDLFSHSVDPTAPCLPLLQHHKETLHIKDIVRSTLLDEATEQAKNEQCYPTVGNLASQRMDTGNLRRAWEYGLRLIVVHAVNSEFLCQIAQLASPCPSDREAIELQIQAAKDYEVKIDEESGGPGEGWYRIVYTPERAREVIGQGKLAVVLGVEASNAFGGCRFVPSGMVEGISDSLETTWELECGYKQASLESLQTQEALALFEHYWQLGVRHFFPIHNMNGTVGGTALSVRILHAETNPAGFKQGDLFDKISDINRTIRAIRPTMQSWDCKSRFEFDDGRCNALGLTETGRSLIKLMASYGVVIDIDHMSRKVKGELLSNDGLLGGVYPFVSSHGGIQEIEREFRNNEGELTVEDFQAIVRAGGAFAPILPPVANLSEEITWPEGETVAPHKCGGTSESFVQAYRYVVEKLNDKDIVLFNGNRPYVGVGFGTDFNAPVPVAAHPRFDAVRPVVGSTFGASPNININIGIGDSMTDSGYCYPRSSLEPRVNYPITSTSPLAPGTPLQKSTIPWGKRPVRRYDISIDGVAHIGMIPDFVEELRALGLTEDELQPLWHGAEAYIRAWETSMAWQGPSFNSEHNKGITEDCRALRAEIIKLDPGQSPKQISLILERLKRKRCHGFPDEGPSRGRGWLYLSDNVLGQPRDTIETPLTAAGSDIKFTFFLRNRGTRPVTVSEIYIENDLGGVLKPDLSHPIIVGVNQIEGFVLEFQPSHEGPFEATVVVLSDEPGLPELPLRVVGQVGAPKPKGQVKISVEKLDFGPVARGSFSTLPILITNTGTMNISMIDAKLALEYPYGQFTLPQTLEQQILPGESRFYNITYTPTAEGIADAEVVLQTEIAAGEIVENRVILHGSTRAPKIILTPALLDFGVAAPSEAKHLTAAISNAGNMELTISGAYIAAGNDSFILDDLQFPLRIGAGQNIEFGVTFTPPLAPGQIATGTIGFTSDDPDSPQINLNMRGASSGVRVEITDFISFEDPLLTDTATVVIYNLGDLRAKITDLKIDVGIYFELINPPQLPLIISPGQKIALTIGLKQLPPSGVYSDTLLLHINHLQIPDVRVGLEIRR